MTEPLIVQGRVVRVSPQDAKIDDFPIFQGMPVEKAQKKIDAIHEGAELQHQHEYMPGERPCQDVIWSVLFIITVVGTLIVGFLQSGKLLEIIEDQSRNRTAPDTANSAVNSEKWLASEAVLVGVSAAASIASLLATLAFFLMLRVAPACMVWSSLIFGGLFTMGLGVALMFMAGLLFVGLILVILILVGLILVVVGALQLALVFCCYRKLIPFMIVVTEVVSEVIGHHPCIIAVGIIGTILGSAWTIGAGLSFASIYVNNQESFNAAANNTYARYSLVFITSLLFSWGAMVSNNVCHVTYCGVFGRWYYGRAGASGSESADNDAHANTLGPSLMAAMTTSFGSICLGSLLVAIVRAMEQVANQMERDARQEGNMVLCVLACLLACVLNCLGDILEYFNDWAYVQCAVRGVKFCDAATLTYSMMTCANVKYILSDLLLNSLVTMGTMMIAAVSTSAGAGFGYFTGGTLGAIWGAILGVVIGLMSGAAALGTINSGVKTILVCWADDPDKLAERHPELHAEFSMRLLANYDEAMKA